MSATAFTTPAALPVQPDAIPPELRDGTQFVAWQWENREGKWTKPPRNARTGGMASSTDPATWTDFLTAYDYASRHYAGRGGVGRVLVAGGEVWGVDLDHCRAPDTGEIAAWAWEIIRALDSYTEVSPSGTGVRIFLKAALPLRSGKRGDVEMYREGRYLTLTGHHLAGTPTRMQERAEAFVALHTRVFADAGANGDTEKRIVPVSVPVDDVPDNELIALALRARNGDKFAGLWAGSTAGYTSQSEADIALCSLISFYTGPDEARIDGLFRRSGLMREKWDLRRGDATYGERTIREAVASRTEYWTPGERYAAHRADATAAPEAWTPLADTWPAPLAEEAYGGIVGEIVRAIEPHTEADPAALLIQLLVAAGNCIGRSPHFMAESDYHALNLYAVLVGESSKGRKGTSWGHIRHLFEQVDAAWMTRIMDGLSSGEGLIHEVRDPQKGTKRDEETILDPGVSDKRLLVQAPEFASVLQVQGRDGSTLSGVLRTAWDRGSLRVMTRKNPLVATHAHISIVGHVTRDELLRLFDATDAANGYANRFLWFAVRRSKLLPLGGRIGDVDLAPLVTRLARAVQFARSVGEITRDEAATALWCDVYADLSDAKPGLLGAMVARAEPQVMRLACLYAVLDLSRVIRADHLLAALAVWAYSAESARWIFGDRLGDPVADEILRNLRMHPDGLSRTEISEVFGRNKSANQITTALHALQGRGMARCEREAPAGGTGRHIERWYPART